MTRSLFPRGVDYHKPDHPKVPNGLGVVYVLGSVIYLFSLHYLGVSGALTLAVCVLFGGLLGLYDDWVDLKWRYKALIPVFASLPLITLRAGETTMATYFLGKVDFGILYYILIVPLIMTVTTNTVNQLGGLNGLETLCPLTVMVGLFVVSPIGGLLLVPILVLAVLGCFNYIGRIFVGNVGTFAEGITLAAFAIIANVEQVLAISLIPFLINSVLIVVNFYLLHRRPNITLTSEGLLTSDHGRSLITVLAHNRRISERKLVVVVCLIVLAFTVLGVVWSLVS